MKFTSYCTRIEGKTAYVFGGNALDFDLEGGLGEVFESLIRTGVHRIVLTMRDMKFLHHTLFSTLLTTQRELDELGGDLILAEVPWFVQMSLEKLGVLHRFAIVPDSLTVSRAEKLTVDLENKISFG